VTAARLADALRRRAAGRARVDLATVWAAFGEVAPAYLGAAEARPHLGELLALLEEEAVLRLPRGKRHYDGSAAPRLPLWVRLPPPGAASVTRLDHRTVAWPPELAFLVALPQLVNLDAALAIKAFLAAGGRERTMVPARERSVELFGDEKRLDRLRSSQLFAAGRLTLATLRCFDVVPPLTWEPGPPGSPRRFLVIENLHTYDSFRRWNAERAAYAAIAYGQGNQLLRTAGDLPRLIAELRIDRVEYFGDLDRRGLAIAAHTAALLRPAIDLVPAVRWYEHLLACADRHLARQSPRSMPVALGDEIDWLPADLRARVIAILADGLRLPQELVGWETLAGEAPFPLRD